MKWRILIGNSARKNLARFPNRDRLRILLVLRDMGENPQNGDIEKIAGEIHAWRRRIGNYRIVYEIDAKQRSVSVKDIRRRTTSTY